jgi:hypothetical protein
MKAADEAAAANTTATDGDDSDDDEQDEQDENDATAQYELVVSHLQLVITIYIILWLFLAEVLYSSHLSIA